MVKHDKFLNKAPAFLNLYISKLNKLVHIFVWV
jgi:hypothetical protein